MTYRKFAPFKEAAVNVDITSLKIPSRLHRQKTTRNVKVKLQVSRTTMAN